MIPIIRNLLDAEAEAEKTVSEARERVQKERGALENEERTRVQEATRAAEEKIQSEIARISAEAKDRIAAAEKEIAADTEQHEARNRDAIEKAVDEVVQAISRSDVELT